MATLNVLAINAGSSSLKASFFSVDGRRQDFLYTGIGHYDLKSYQKLIKELVDDLKLQAPDVVAHRFVHGGDVSESARLVDDVEHKRLKSIIHLAPLHLPTNLLVLDLCSAHFNVPQIACFDTSFHHTMPALSQRLPIPKGLGIHRYGFHGLNYAYIAKRLPDVIGDIAYKKVVVAHLGSGASLCLMENLESVDTTMGYTPAGGVTMGTRSGDLDPGVMLALAEKLSLEKLRNLVFHGMGLFALSEGESADMQTLLSSNSSNAKFAVEYFCQQVRAAIGGLASKVGGIDALIFSAGIGEHAPIIREKICSPLAFLGIELDENANKNSLLRIERNGCKPVAIIPADEEIMIRDLCAQLMNE
jgi:acetate kinase